MSESRYVADEGTLAYIAQLEAKLENAQRVTFDPKVLEEMNRLEAENAALKEDTSRQLAAIAEYERENAALKEQEPVAWAFEPENGLPEVEWGKYEPYADIGAVTGCHNWIPLYAAPVLPPAGWVMVPVEPVCGKNYEAGLWSRRNYEAWMEDQTTAPEYKP